MVDRCANNKKYFEGRQEGGNTRETMADVLIEDI